MQGDYDCVQYFELVICYPILFCHLGPLQYQIGSSRVENYVQIKKDYSCEMDQAIAPCLAFPVVNATLLSPPCWQVSELGVWWGN